MTTPGLAGTIQLQSAPATGQRPGAWPPRLERDDMAEPTEKTCCECGETKPLAQFHRQKTGALGRVARCKPCQREQHRRHQEAYRRKHPNVARNYRTRFPERRKARDAVTNAVRDGRLTRPAACARCGSEGSVQGHHADYSKPLQVEWLCGVCHRAVHDAAV